MVRPVRSLFSLIALVAILTPHTESAITCGTVVTGVAPCLAYGEGRGPLTPVCCNSLRGIFAAAKTTQDRQMACSCLKGVAKGIKGLNLELAAAAPAKCGFTAPFPIKLSTDCTKVK